MSLPSYSYAHPVTTWWGSVDPKFDGDHCTISNPHSNAAVDLNGDCLAGEMHFARTNREPLLTQEGRRLCRVRQSMVCFQVLPDLGEQQGRGL